MSDHRADAEGLDGNAADRQSGPVSAQSSLHLMMDIPLDVTVELGRATLPLAEVLAIGPGSVIELDRLPGEPLDLLANGRLIARGEVVVLNETFGLRITEIVHKDSLQAAG